MKKISFLSMLLISIIGFNGCMSTSGPSSWSSEKLNSWFSSGEWHGGWKVKPDHSVDSRELADSYHKLKERWDKAFRFLNDNNLDEMQPGRYDIDGDNLYATISNYMTKDPDSANFEVHRSYIDIQYVIDGKELIGIAPVDSVDKVVTPYDAERDIEFVTVQGATYNEATPLTFFIFFPNDAHKPGLRDSVSTPVKKIVIKLKKE